MREDTKYRFIINNFISSYSVEHSRKEVLNLLKEVIDKQNVKELPTSLKRIDKTRLSLEVSKLVTEHHKYFSPEEREYYVNTILPVIIKQRLLENKRKNNFVSHVIDKLVVNANKFKEKTSCSLNKKVVVGALVTSTVIFGAANMKTDKVDTKVNEKTESSNREDKEYIGNSIVEASGARVVVDSAYEMSEEELKYKDIGTNDRNNIVQADGLRVGVDSTFELTEEQMKVKKEEERKKAERKEAERRALEEYALITKKQKVFNNPKEINTLNDIFEAKEELESLGLTDEDKIYPDCPLSAELQWFIDGQSKLRGIPTAFPFSIVSTETRGQFNSSGVTAYNVDSVDLGLSQQNSKYRVPLFAEKYNIDYNTAYLLIRDNDYVNMISAFDTISDIDRVKGNFQPIEYAGCYNGWLRWRDYETSRQYVAIFNEAYGEYASTKVQPKILTK